MCLEYYPECGDGGDSCCERQLTIALAYAKRHTKRNGSTVPRIHCRRVDFQLYACWAVKDGTRVSDFVDACCPVCAKADFIANHFSTKRWTNSTGCIHWKTPETATSVGGRLLTIKAHQKNEGTSFPRARAPQVSLRGFFPRDDSSPDRGRRREIRGRETHSCISSEPEIRACRPTRPSTWRGVLPTFL